MPDPTRQVHGRLLVVDEDDNFINVSDYLVDAEINEGDVSGVGTQAGGSDNVVRTLRFTLHNEGADRFNPRDQDSSWNQINGSYSPLLWPNREVYFAYDITEPGASPTWVHLFDGLLGDSIIADGPRVHVQCRDMSKRLQDRLITERREYGAPGGRRADLVIQDILDDEFGVGEINLIVEDTPDFYILPYFVEYKTVWDAIQEVVNQFGWFCGQRFYAPDGVYRLTLLEPPRDKDAADYALSASDHYYTRELEVSDRDIRNEVHVVYRDAATDEREEVIEGDAASIADFGLRPMIIEEGGSRLITDAASATALAEYAVHDLSQPRSDFQVELILFPEIELYTTFSIDDPKISSTVDFFGAESVRHRLDFNTGRFRTTVIGTERVVGGHLRWVKQDSRPGAKKPIETGEVEPEAIDRDRLRDGAITEPKYSDDSISTPKIQHEATTAGEFIQITDATGTFTDSPSYVDIPGYEVTFNLDENNSLVFFYYSMWVDVIADTANNPQWWNGRVRLLVDGGAVNTEFTEVEIRGESEPWDDAGTLRQAHSAAVGMQFFEVLDAGAHEVKGQFAIALGESIESFNRTLGIIHFKR